jgi:AcrR family transcriptional regulator
VARPKIPLISRRKTLDAALKIIDNEGLDGLSIRRLAAELHVNGASLYHHFANKEDIVVGATELALAEVRTPTETDESWQVWLPRNGTLLREAMRMHPQLIPVIVRRSELGMGRQMLESSAVRLVDEGVSLGAVAPLLDALETFAIGSAIHEVRDAAPGAEDCSGSVLSEATRCRSLSADEIYAVVSRAIVEAVETAAGANQKERSARSPIRSIKKAPAKKAPAKKAPAACPYSTAREQTS